MRRYRLQGLGPNPGVEKNMTKKVLLIAGVLLAAGSIAAISSPYVRNGHLRLGELLAEFGDGDFGSHSGRSGKRHRDMDDDDGGQIGMEDFSRSRRRAHAARRDPGGDEDMPQHVRERTAHRWVDRDRDRRTSEGGSGEEVGRVGVREGRSKPERQSGRDERQFSRLDRNGDGFIDAKEFEIWWAERSVRASQRFFKRFDSNGDGVVSRDEFRQFVKDRLANRDADGDDRLRRQSWRRRTPAVVS
jgi:hypothetical protein